MAEQIKKKSNRDTSYSPYLSFIISNTEDRLSFEPKEHIKELSTQVEITTIITEIGKRNIREESRGVEFDILF